MKPDAPQKPLTYADAGVSIAAGNALVKAIAPLPVCAGFGIRSRDQVQRLAAHVDGVIVGSALVEAIERGDDVGAFLESLRA